MTRGRSAPRRFVHSLALTACAEAGAILGAVVALAVVSRTRSPFDFGLYTVSLRVIALFHAPLLIGLGVTLPRLMARGREDRERADLLVGALAILAVVSACVLSATVVARSWLAGVVYGTAEQDRLIVAVAAMTCASALHGIVYAYMRGLLAFGRANLLSAVNLGVAPLIAALTTSGVMALVLTVSSIWTITSVVASASYLRAPRRLPATSARLVRLGWRRVPGEFALFGLVAVPPLLTRHYEGVVVAGQVSLAMTLLTLAGTAAAPFSFVLLPHVSGWLDRGEQQKLERLMRRTLLTLALLLIPGLVLVELALPLAVPAVFGESAASAVPIVRVLLLAAPAYVTYVTLRSLIDGSSEKATTMTYALIAFAAFVLTAYVLRLLLAEGLASLLVATVVGLWVLAVLVLHATWRMLQEMTMRSRNGLTGTTR